MTISNTATQTKYTLQEYLELCKTDKLAYATAAERMVAAIGEPTLVDTSKDSRLGTIFQNRTIRVYEAFKHFYGAEQPIEDICNFYRHAAQGLEESKQILYLLGPVGGGKSSFAEQLKKLMQKFPIYVLAIETKKGVEYSPINESPLGVFDPDTYAEEFQEKYGIDASYLTGLMSPWAVKRLEELGDDPYKFVVVKRQPSILKQIAISKTEPGDENNQDISALVGKTDIRQLEHFSQNDTDSYSYSGGLCLSNQGLLEFVEMFKAPIKVLNPLLTATQERNYKGTEQLGAIPFDGVILAHSNQTEWTSFKNNPANEAFLNRVVIVKIPYCLRVDEEVKIYEKMLRGSKPAISKAPIAPKTLEFLAKLAVLSRLEDHENSDHFSKMEVYNGQNVKESRPKARSIQEYRDKAGQDEGMAGVSTRFCFKVLSDVFSRDIAEVAADPVLLIDVLTTKIEKEQFPEAIEQKLLEFIKVGLTQEYIDFIAKEIQAAYLQNSNDYGQTCFDKYIDWADHWINQKDFKDQNTGTLLSLEALDKELQAIEVPAHVSNPRDFRNEVVMYSLRYRAENQGKNPEWTSYTKLREVIEKRIFSSMDEALPVVSFGTKRSEEDEKKHDGFVARMKAKGYTERQAQRVVEYYYRVKKAG